MKITKLEDVDWDEAARRAGLLPRKVLSRKEILRYVREIGGENKLKPGKHGYPIGFETIRVGYKWVKTPEGWKKKSRLVFENLLGRKLKRSEIVHHIDLNPLNDEPANLGLTTNWGHARVHNKILKEKKLC